jgi:hypothetical protein
VPLEELDLRDAVLAGCCSGTGEVTRYLATYGQWRVRAAALLAPLPLFLPRSAVNPDGADRGVYDDFLVELTADHVPYLAIADLAAAAVRAERHLEARTLIENVLTRAGLAPGRGWTSSPPAPAGCSPNQPTPRPTSPKACRTPTDKAGHSSEPSCGSTTGNGCGGSGESTTPSPSSPAPWRRSAALVPRPGPGARKLNCGPAA